MNGISYCAQTDQTDKISYQNLFSFNIYFKGPWMPGVDDLPYCNNFTDMRALLSSYQTYVLYLPNELYNVSVALTVN